MENLNLELHNLVEDICTVLSVQNIPGGEALAYRATELRKKVAGVYAVAEAPAGDVDAEVAALVEPSGDGS